MNGEPNFTLELSEASVALIVAGGHWRRSVPLSRRLRIIYKLFLPQNFTCFFSRQAYFKCRVAVVAL